MGDTVQKARKRLRALRLNPRLNAHHRLRWLHAQKCRSTARPNCITPSRSGNLRVGAAVPGHVW